MRNNEYDKKTGGPFLIQLCMNVKMLPVIAKEPTMIQIVDESEVIVPPTLYNVRNVNVTFDLEDISKEWIQNAFNLLEVNKHPMHLKKEITLNTNWDTFKELSKLMSEKLVSRM